MHSLFLPPLLLPLLLLIFPATVVQSFSPSPLRSYRSLTPGLLRPSCPPAPSAGASASAAPRLTMAAGAEFNWKTLKKSTEEKMSKSVEAIQAQFNTIRAGGANPSILDRVMVDYFGSPTPLNQVARVGASGAQTLVIEPFDKTLVKEVERAIAQADLGLAAQNDGSGVLRINLPALTEERRKDLVKQAKALCEEGKVAVRNVRRDFVDKVKAAEKDKAISKDDSKAYQVTAFFSSSSLWCCCWCSNSPTDTHCCCCCCCCRSLWGRTSSRR